MSIRKNFPATLERVVAIHQEDLKVTEIVAIDTQAVLADLAFLLASESPDETELLYAEARRIRDAECGRRMILRGLVEFSSFCGNSCRYCGLNRTNASLERYRLTREEILESADRIAQAGIRTIVLQSGEDGCDAEWLAETLYKIKIRHDMAITLSVGERQRADYALWKDVGADRFLMRVESSDPELYAALHRDRTLETRLRCLEDLRELGYQVGSGIMVGPPGQTFSHIARDILFFRDQKFDMIGIGPFIPHQATPFRDATVGSLVCTLNTVALTRILTGNTWLPATTALGSMGKDYRIAGLRAGANVVMPNFSPTAAKRKYEIYPGKRCISEQMDACTEEMKILASQAELKLDYARADSLKMKAVQRNCQP